MEHRLRPRKHACDLNSEGPRPSAVICGNDYLAIGALLKHRRWACLSPRIYQLPASMISPWPPTSRRH